MASLRQITSNRRNALKSTGPNTPEGKAVARANALKHGLAGDGVVLPDEEAGVVARRLEEWGKEYVLATAEDRWAFEQMVVSTVRIDHAQEQDMELSTQLAHHAAVCWDNDQRVAAEELGARLSRKPSWVSLKLKGSKHGCIWLQEQWQVLGVALAGEGRWTEEERLRAGDLLGFPPELRDMLREGDVADDRALMAEEMERLAQCREGLDRLDEYERQAAERGMPVEMPKEVVLLQRYEAAWYRRYYRTRQQLRGKERPDRGAAAPTVAECPLAEVEVVVESQTQQMSPAPEVEADPAPAPLPEPVSAPVAVPVPVSAPEVVRRAPVMELELGARFCDAIEPILPVLNRRDRRAARSQARSR